MHICKSQSQLPLQQSSSEKHISSDGLQHLLELQIASWQHCSSEVQEDAGGEQHLNVPVPGTNPQDPLQQFAAELQKAPTGEQHVPEVQTPRQQSPFDLQEEPP
ncbi:hypothetical protein CCACVL1_11713 [Corchorus capsularis]|uniref:Uncharacterized protein n=1 Tax=Corchorus capsularis TaxID=210143 RepID=A0A1R3IJV8_COCAP|nr:hypothetical protein CCACVL1_11713 [Corchorus capsularis]